MLVNFETPFKYRSTEYLVAVVKIPNSKYVAVRGIVPVGIDADFMKYCNWSMSTHFGRSTNHLL